MEFSCLIIRSYEDRQSGAMYPIADKVTKSILLTSDDGIDTKRTVGTAWRHSNGSFGFDTRVEIIVTDVRVAISVPKYKKGGGWTGSIVGLLMNIPSYALAAHRHSQKTMLGHLHYPWLSLVGHSTEFSMVRSTRQCDQLQLGYLVTSDDDPIRAGITISLSRDVDGPALANEVLRRACRHRLARHPHLDDEQRTILHDFATNGMSRSVEKDSFTQAVIPAAMVPDPRTAFYTERSGGSEEDPSG